MSTNHYTMFCLPPAGCSANIYFPWKKKVAPHCQVVALEYPGHGTKLSKALVHDVSTLAEQLVNDMVAHCTQDFILFGHSLGGGLVFAMIERLKSLGMLHQLKLVVISCRPAPEYSEHIVSKHVRTDEEMLAELKKYDYLPEAILNNPSLLAFCLKLLRHDFSLSDQLIQHPPQKIDLPLLAIYGNADPDLPEADFIQAWQHYSSQWQGAYAVPGDHFYFRNEDSLMAMLHHVEYIFNQQTVAS